MLAGLASEMGDMVKQGVELARQGEGIRNAFERLGRGDLLDGLRQATHGTVTDLELMKAAVKFNDFKLPLDELGTMLAFAQQKAKDTGQSVDYMVDSIVTGLGRKSLMILDNLGLSASEVKERMAETGDMTKAVGAIIREQMAKAGDYVETAADRATKANVELTNAMTSLGNTLQPLTDASNSLWNSIKVGALEALNTAVKPLIQALAEAGALGSGARATAGFNRLGGGSKVDRMIGRLGNGKTAGAYSIYTQQLGEFDKYINNKRFQIAAYGNDNSSVAQSAKQRLQAELDGALKMRAEYVKRAQELHNKVPSPLEPATTSGGATGRRGGSSRGGFDVSKIAFDENKAALAAVKMPEIEGGSEAWNTMREAIAGCKEEMADYSAETANWTKNFDPYRENMEKMAKAAKQQQMAFNMGAEAAANLGAAFASMEDPAAKAAGTVISAIANVALGFGSAVAQASSMGPYAWIAYVAAAMGAMATAISTVHSLTGFAEGGMVKGNSYSGDNIGGLVDGSQLVGLNAGEIVLNHSQQSTLASRLQNNGGVMNIQGVLQGENILLSIKRTLKRTGQGELVTWG